MGSRFGWQNPGHLFSIFIWKLVSMFADFFSFLRNKKAENRLARDDAFKLFLLFSGVGFISFLIVQPFWVDRFYAPFDLNFMTIPDRASFSLALKRGEWGFWYPLVWRGLDHLGFSETGMFHPFHLLSYRFLPFSWALLLEMLAPIPLLFLGTYFLLRRGYGLRMYPAYFGAALLAFSIFPMSHFVHVHMCLIFAHLPWVLWAVEGVFRSRRPFFPAVGVAFLYASMFLLCHPQMPFVVSLGVGLVVIRHGVWAGIHSKSFRRRLALLLVAGITGLLLGMPQIYATLSALKQSDRGHLTAAERGNFSLPPIYLTSNLCPGFFRSHVPRDWVYGADGQKLGFFGNGAEFSGYFGFALLCLLYSSLVLLGVNRFCGSARITFWTLLGGGVFILLLAMGRYVGISSVLGHIPLLSLFRCANRYKGVLCAILAFSGAAELQAIERVSWGPEVWKRKAGWLLLPFFFSLGLSLVAGFSRSIVYQGEPLALGRGWSLFWGPAVALVVPVLILWPWRGRGAALGVLGLVCFLDLAGYGLPHVRQVPYRSLAEIQQLRGSLEQAHPFRWISANNSPLWQGAFLATGYLGMKPRPILDFTDVEQARLASIAVWRDDAGKSWVFPGRHLPRFRLVPNLVIRQGPLKELKKFDPEQVAFCSPGASVVSNGLSGPPLSRVESLRLLKDFFDCIELQVYTEHRRLLVCSDRYAPGWRVTVNGQETPIIPLYDNALRGVVIPAGDSKVVWRYFPPSLLVGLRLACMGSILLFGLLVGGIVQIFSRNREQDVLNGKKQERGMKKCR